MRARVAASRTACPLRVDVAEPFDGTGATNARRVVADPTQTGVGRGADRVENELSANGDHARCWSNSRAERRVSPGADVRMVEGRLTGCANRLRLRRSAGGAPWAACAPDAAARRRRSDSAAASAPAAAAPWRARDRPRATRGAARAPARARWRARRRRSARPAPRSKRAGAVARARAERLRPAARRAIAEHARAELRRSTAPCAPSRASRPTDSGARASPPTGRSSASSSLAPLVAALGRRAPPRRRARCRADRRRAARSRAMPEARRLLRHQRAVREIELADDVERDLARAARSRKRSVSIASA